MPRSSGVIRKGALRTRCPKGSRTARCDRRSESLGSGSTKTRDNAPTRRRRRSKTDPAILTGLLFDGAGNRFTPSHTMKKGRCYRYYISQAAIKRGKKATDSPLRLPAKEIEGIVQSEIAHLARSPQRFAKCISDAAADPSVMADVERVLSGRNMPRDAVSAIIFQNINRIVVDEQGITVSISRGSRILPLAFLAPDITEASWVTTSMKRRHSPTAPEVCLSTGRGSDRCSAMFRSDIRS